MTDAQDGDIAFAFNGKRLIGRAGDTVAAALLRNGIRLVGRSFRRHRPRGVFALGAEEPNAWLTIDGTPTVRATQLRLSEGLDVRSQNVWPSLRFDVGRVLGAATTWLPPGFYYKTFMWPHFRFYESAIRRQAGLGRVPAISAEGRHEQRRVTVDVLVIGGGASGVAAARAHSARRILLTDDHSPEPVEGIEILAFTTAVAIYDDKLVLLAQRIGAHERLWWIRASLIVLATGAAERPLLFANNDRPGVMLAGAAEVYQRDYQVDLRRIVVFTNNDSGAEVAARMSRNGANVVALVDSRTDGSAREVAAGTVYCGWEVKDTRGRARISCVAIGDVDGGRELDLACDTLCVAGGWNPRLQLYSQAGGKLRFDALRQCFVPANDPVPDGIVVVGRANGSSLPSVACSAVPIGRRVFVDLAYDVTTADLEIAAREGFDAPELAKRFTTVGMAPDQGKTSNVNAVLALAQIRGVSPAVVGTTTMRPPYEPVSIDALVGSNRDELARAIRRLPLHEWHEARGAELEVYSGWWRSAVYPRSGESESAAIEREVLHTRRCVSLIDSSSLTKILVVGRDAADFLNRIYANSIRNLRVGQVRYGLMLNDEGIVKDDGVLACLASERYLVSASSAGGGAVYLAMDRLLQTEWRDLHVAIELVTTQWCTLCVCGPRAHAVVSEVLPGLPAAIPHMSVHEMQLDGMHIIVMAVSFTGERSFEISVPAGRAQWLCELLLRVGDAHSLALLGLEALDVLRLEKGYLEIGVDTDVDTAPIDVGWAKALQQKHADFIGKRSLSLPAFKDPRRKQLVGLNSEIVLPIGGVIVDAKGALQGHVTSSARSPTLARPIALALLADGYSRLGASFAVVSEGLRIPATVVDSRFFDPEHVLLRQKI